MASELFPLLAKAKGVKAGFGLVAGFLAGLATVFGVEHIASRFEVRRRGRLTRCACADTPVVP